MNVSHDFYSESSPDINVGHKAYVSQICSGMHLFKTCDQFYANEK